MNDVEKNQEQLKVVLANLDNNFIEDYEFWKRLVDDIKQIMFSKISKKSS